MRITSNMLMGGTMSRVNAVAEKMYKLNNQITSGKKLSRPSDNPVDAAKSLSLRSSLREVEQYQRNIDNSQSWLEETDLMMQHGISVMQNIRDLVLQVRNDTNGVLDKLSMKQNIDQLHGELKTVANHSVAGRYIFGGTKTQTQPFDLATFTYNGNSVGLDREIAKGTVFTVNVTGDELFAIDASQPYGGMLMDGSGLNSIFKVLEDLSAKLGGTPDPNDFDFYIGRLDTSLDNMYDKLGEVGAKAARVEMIQGQHVNTIVNITGYLAKNEDVDMVEAVSQLQLQQTIYEATLAAGAKLMQTSLLDFLR